MGLAMRQVDLDRLDRALTTLLAPLVHQCCDDWRLAVETSVAELLDGDHVVFVCGEDGDAKGEVEELLESFGWPAERIVDLGGIAAARGTEMYLPLWLALYGKLGSGDFNIALERPR